MNIDTGLNIYYTKNFIDEKDSKHIFNTLEKQLQYNSAEDSKVLIRGKNIEIPRTQVTYGDPGTYYSLLEI